MDEQDVRAHARTMCAVETATADFSPELRRNLGEVIALLPLPANEASVESVDHGGSGYNVVLRLIGQTDDVQIQTRWKDRDGKPTVVEASHLSKTVIEPVAEEGEEEGAAEGGRADERR